MSYKRECIFFHKWKFLRDIKVIIWDKTPEDIVGYNYEQEWQCSKCGKRKRTEIYEN